MKFDLRQLLVRLLAFLVMTYGLQGCISNPDFFNFDESNQLQSIDDLNIVRIATERLAKVNGADHVLVIFDLDNTLLAMEENLGSDQWYEWQTKKIAKNDPRRVPDVLLTQRTLFYLGNMRPTQPNVSDIVRKIQIRGFPVIVVTSRDANTRFSTYRELRRNNLSFRDSAFGPEGWYQQKVLSWWDCRTSTGLFSGWRVFFGRARQGKYADELIYKNRVGASKSPGFCG